MNEEHEIGLGARCNGVWIECSCGWDQNLGVPTTEVVDFAAYIHTAMVQAGLV